MVDWESDMHQTDHQYAALMKAILEYALGRLYVSQDECRA